MALDDFRTDRINKLERLRRDGVDPYPTSTQRTATIAQVIERFDEREQAGGEVTLVGRVVAQRGHGGLTFLDLDDGSDAGTLQALFSEEALGASVYAQFTTAIDVGDFVEVTGKLLKTKRGERSIAVARWRMLAKSIRPLPEKWHGLQDVEERYRARHLDLLFNPEVKKRFLVRFRVTRLLRQFYADHGYLEVETPILQTIPGGATARPFKTHMNDLDLDLYLRVAPELYLKRLLVGGFERVFEIGKNFRNEGMDREHNPEFTMLEAYAAYQDHEWLMALTEELMVFVATELFGKPEIPYNDGFIRLERPFTRMTFAELASKASGMDYERATADELAAKATELGIVVEKGMTKAVLGDEISKKTLRHTLVDPVFVVGHPLELSPLSKRVAPDSDTVARFQLIMGGRELTNGFAELNDPLDQAERFAAQQKLREAGNQEAHRVDQDYLEAMEYGMPPAAGIGIGVDRLVALLTGARSLRDVLLYPTMRPTKTE